MGSIVQRHASGDVSYLQYQHPAMCTFSCESLEMKCCYSGKPSDLKDEHKQWFTQVRVKDACIILMLSNLRL